MDAPELDTGRLQHVADSKNCPVCGALLDYESVYMGHVGVYDCRNCDFSRPPLDYRVSNVRFDGARGSEFLLSTPKGGTAVRIEIPGLYNLYNAAAAAAVAAESSIGLGDIARGLPELGELSGGSSGFRPGSVKHSCCSSRTRWGSTRYYGPS